MNHNTADRLEDFVDAVEHMLGHVAMELGDQLPNSGLMDAVKDKAEALRCAIRADETILRTR